MIEVFKEIDDDKGNSENISKMKNNFKNLPAVIYTKITEG